MKRKQDSPVRNLCEVEVTEGLEPITRDELTKRFGKLVDFVPTNRAGELRFYFSGALGQLRSLQTAYAVYLVYSFEVPRPRALLGDAHFRRLLEQIDIIRDLNPNAYRTFSIAAAGSDSSVMNRIKTDITTQTELVLSPQDKGDLYIRIRPGQNGWQTLVRVSARPLVTRAWRVCNFEGALNAATAHAMIRLADTRHDDAFLNIGCGSGSLLIERLNYGTARLVVGIDISREALRCADENLKAAGEPTIKLIQADMTHLPIESSSINQVTADLPFGQLSGNHEHNVTLYPLVLAETARVTRPDGQFTLITHEIRLMDRLLRDSKIWRVEQSIQVNLRGLHPRIYVLRRTVSDL